MSSGNEVLSVIDTLHILDMTQLSLGTVREICYLCGTGSAAGGQWGRIRRY